VKNDDMVFLVLGGLGLLWLVTQASPAAQATQQAALANAAALQSQNIQTQANMQNVQTGANLIQNLASDFS
jgi:hypothetical protein